MMGEKKMRRAFFFLEKLPLAPWLMLMILCTINSLPVGNLYTTHTRLISGSVQKKTFVPFSPSNNLIKKKVTSITQKKEKQKKMRRTSRSQTPEAPPTPI